MTFKLNLKYASNPKWSNRSHSAIDVVARFHEIEEDLPFTANPDDVEAHGRDIYYRASSGEFGPIAEFEATPLTEEVIAEWVRDMRNKKLELDVDPWVTNPLRWNDLTEDQQQAMQNFRTALLDITEHPDFPWYNTVVVEVDYGFDYNLDLIPWPVKPF